MTKNNHTDFGPAAPCDNISDSLSKLVEFIAKSIVDDPNGVVVTEKAGKRTIVIELAVSKSDVGKIIGRQGSTAESIRTVLSCAATKLKKRTLLLILKS